MVGIHARPVEVDLVRLVRRRWQIRGTFSSPARIWPEVVEMLAEEPAAYGKLITHRLPLDRALEGFALAGRRESSKVILIPG